MQFYSKIFFLELGKFVVVFPLASSITPKSGDTNLMSALIKAEDTRYYFFILTTGTLNFKLTLKLKIVL